MPDNTNKGRLRNDNIDDVFEKLEGGNKPSSGASKFDWHYPYELTSAESQHFILFTCYAEGPASFETKIIKQSKSRGGSLVDTLSSSFGGGGAAGMGGVIGSLGGSNEEIVATTRVGAKRDLSPQESIALYMTPQVAYQQKVDYEMTETHRGGVSGWFGNLFGGMGDWLSNVTTIGGENNRLAANGEAKNPNKEALFKEMTESEVKSQRRIDNIDLLVSKFVDTLFQKRISKDSVKVGYRKIFNFDSIEAQASISRDRIYKRLLMNVTDVDNYDGHETHVLSSNHFKKDERVKSDVTIVH